MSTPTCNDSDVDSTARNDSSSGGQESQNALTTAELISEIDSFKKLALFSTAFVVGNKDGKLTTDEIDARKAWNNVRLEFIYKNKQYFYISAVPRVVTTAKEFLSSAIIPPKFSASIKAVSVRSRYDCDEQRSRRKYPPIIMKWELFPLVMEKITPSTTKFASRELVSNPLTYSAGWLISSHNEADEETFLKTHLWEPCCQAGLMFNRDRVENVVAESEISAIVGRPDSVEYAISTVSTGTTGTTGRITAVIECKSSHNMLLPNEFEKLKTMYDAAVTDQTTQESRERSEGWSHICHPLGQLFGYMVDNAVRFGALCSASKTYFVFFDGEVENIGEVRITEARFTSDNDFLLAWASFVQEARLPAYDTKEMEKFQLPEEWLNATPIKDESEKEAPRLEIQSNSNGGPGGGTDGGPHSEHRGGSDGGGDSRGSAGGGGLPRANGPDAKIPQDTKARLGLRRNVPTTVQAKPNWPKRSPTFPGLLMIRHQTALERLTRFLVFSGSMRHYTILKMTLFSSMIRPISKLARFWGEAEMETSF
jgi:hypothetical protein